MNNIEKIIRKYVPAEKTGVRDANIYGALMDECGLDYWNDDPEDIDLSENEIVSIIIDGEFVSVQSEEIHREWPEVWTAYFFSCPGGIYAWWEEYANHDTCQTQGRADSGVEIVLSLDELKRAISERREQIKLDIAAENVYEEYQK
jgi:hypothetical protein